uniref:triacylglycerol lipase n=1 Tax=[Candida] hispaniensis TaxID=312227 RepID=A0A078BNM9_9ASCO|nr:lipase [[Candida] hispaniensis]
MKFSALLASLAIGTTLARPLQEVEATNESGKNSQLLEARGYASVETAQVSQDTYNKLLKYSRLTAISYCVGHITEVLKPFKCISYCSFFPHTELIKSYRDEFNDLSLTSYLAVDHDSKEIYTVLRGSHSVEDWMVDFTVRQESIDNMVWGKNATASQSCQKCKVHKGFLTAYTLTYEKMHNDIEATIAEYPEYSLTITGHSLGAAVALLLGVSMKVNGHNPLVVTYGQPLVGNQEFANWVDTLFFGQTEPNALIDSPERKLYRVTHRGDVVTNVPSWGDYTHASGEVFLDTPVIMPKTSQVKFCQGQNNKKCSDGNLISQKLVMANHAHYFVSQANCLAL